MKSIFKSGIKNKMARGFCGVLFTGAVLSLALATPAQAGTWEIERTAQDNGLQLWWNYTTAVIPNEDTEGNITYTPSESDSWQGQLSGNEIVQWTSGGYARGPLGIKRGPNGLYMTRVPLYKNARLRGRLSSSTILRWVPRHGVPLAFDPAPKRVYLIEKIKTKIAASDDAVAGGVLQANALLKANDKTVINDVLYQEIEKEYVQVRTVINGMVQLPTRTWYADLAVSGTGLGGSDNNNNIFPFFFYHDVEFPNVEIFSDIESSYYKGGQMALLNGVITNERMSHDQPPNPNQPDDKVLDSAVELKESVFLYGEGVGLPSDQRWVADATFGINQELFSAPLATWTYAGAGAAVWPKLILTPAGDRASMHADMGDKTEVSGFPKSSTIKVVVIDAAPGAPVVPVNGKFTIKWHLPFEKTADLGIQTKKEKLEKVFGPVAPAAQMSVVLDPPRVLNIAAGIEGVAGVVGVLGPEKYAAAAAVAYGLYAVTGLVNAQYEYAGSDVTIAQLHGPDLWQAVRDNADWRANVEGENAQANLSITTGWDQYECEYWQVKRFYRHRWEADQYDHHGYVDTGHILYTDKVFAVERQPYFRPLNTTPPTTGP